MARKSLKGFLKCFRTDCLVKPERPEISAPKMSGADNYGYLLPDKKQRKEDRKTRRGLHRFAKSVLFDSSLVRKVLKKQSKHKFFETKQNTLLVKTKQPSDNSANYSAKNDKKTNSYYDSTQCSSLQSAFIASPAPSGSSKGSSVIPTIEQNKYLKYEQTKEPSSRKILMGKNRSLNYGLCFFAICLFALTCWGKVCAIICTSALFVLVPSSVKRVRHHQFGSPEMDLKKHKRRIVVEG